MFRRLLDGRDHKVWAFFIDLKSIKHKFSSDYGLNIYFSRRFAYIDSPSFSPYKPLQNVDFSKVGNMQFFSGTVLRGKSLRICFSSK